MKPMYFRITGPPDPTVFDSEWVEIPAHGERFCVNRRIWRAPDVSRTDASCVAVRPDPEDETWVIKNGAVGRVLVMQDGENRYDLRTSMSVDLGARNWLGTITGVLTFELTHDRPAEPIRVHGADDAAVTEAPTAGDMGVVPVDPGQVWDLDLGTQPDSRKERARRYLQRHWLKRLALASLWREHLEHTPGIAEDLTSAAVGQAFNERAATITGWREDLAMAVYGERGHQGSIRDFVLHHRLLTHTDVEEADRYVRCR